tara:strand:- start:3305 stop:3940 length:636 start_codon:yes stop_codon:yes gene_type:complete
MNKIMKRSFYIFWIPIIGFWFLLLTIYINKEFGDLKILPSILYFFSSFLTIFSIQNIISSSEYDVIIKNAKARGLLTCLLISSISILFDFFYFDESKSLVPSFVIIFSSIIGLFLSGLFDFSQEQLNEKFLDRSSERNFSIKSRERWVLYLDKLEENFPASERVQNEINRIRKILPYSSFFRNKNAENILEELSKINNEEQLISIIIKYVR